MAALSPRSLDRDDPLPLWAQLEAELRRRLAAGDFRARFPTDQELVEAYEVSRHTVREAVRRLRAEGVLHRRRGRGSYVDPAALEQPLGALYSLFRSVEAQGLAQRSDVLALERRTDEEAAGALGEPPEAPLVYLARVRHAGADPLAVDRAWLPASVAAPLLDVDFTRTALYDELAARCGVRLVGGSERIAPTLPSERDAERLEVPAGTPAFAVERVGRSIDRVVEFRRTVIRGDRYAFVADWGDGGASGLRADRAGT